MGEPFRTGMGVGGPKSYDSTETVFKQYSLGTASAMAIRETADVEVEYHFLQTMCLLPPFSPLPGLLPPWGQEPLVPAPLLFSYLAVKRCWYAPASETTLLGVSKASCVLEWRRGYPFKTIVVDE